MSRSLKHFSYDKKRTYFLPSFGLEKILPTKSRKKKIKIKYVI